jgi:hypothetical protein
MAKYKFSESLSSGVHKMLKELVGEWEGTASTWFEPGKLADESSVHGKISSILGGRFILHEYKGSIENKPLEGLNIIGFDCMTGKYQSAWVDSFHMGSAIMISEGKQGNEKFDVMGHYDTNEEGTEKWGWRTELNIIDNNNLTITSFNVMPTGEEARATEIIYKRK